MKYKLLLLFMLVAGVCQGQGVYKYRKVEVTCKIHNKPVAYDGYSFVYTDSIATINISFYELSPSSITIFNNTDKAIKFLWKDFMAYGDYKRFYGEIDPVSIDNKSDGEQYIYGGDVKSFVVIPTWSNIDEMFPKKADGKGTVSLKLVLGEKSFLYYFDLTSKYVP